MLYAMATWIAFQQPGELRVRVAGTSPYLCSHRTDLPIGVATAVLMPLVPPLNLVSKQ